MRDHGGNPDAARARYGGEPGDWVDLSTGINRRPYPMPPLAPADTAALPTTEAITRVEKAARSAYAATGTCVALAGAQAAIQLIPQLLTPGRVTILGPTYNEHAAAFRTYGWDVAEVSDPAELAGGDAAVVVNPNNPSGLAVTPEMLKSVEDRLRLLVVDESFCDMTPGVSYCPRLGAEQTIVLRSFGKFYGLAGLRLGFALGHPEIMGRLRDLAGPWPVSGPALAAGTAALSDSAWRDQTIARLAQDATELDRLAQMAGWQVAGGTTLFRLYRTPEAASAQDMLARHLIWSRIFPWSSTLLRLGLPGPEREWIRLQRALSG